jgi:hypothetical protein
MIFLLTIIYSLIGIWVTINAGFKGGIPFTDIEFNNNKIALIVAILCGLLWPGLIFIPLFNSFTKFLNV